MKNFIITPSLEEVQNNMPLHCRNFPTCKYLLDCIEIPVTAPNCITCKHQMFSFYKKLLTLKDLIISTPDGLIAYVGSLYGGKASDHLLFHKSEIVRT